MAFDPFDAPPGLSLSGYRLEKPLVADANAATTAATDNVIGVGIDTPTEWLSGGIFDADDNDRSRRKEYLIRAQRNPVTDLDQEHLEDVRFEWTVNEGIGTTRQEYLGFHAALRRWDLLHGRGPLEVGTVGVSTAFLKPIPNEDLFTLPTYREPVTLSVSIVSPSSLFGTQLLVSMVDVFGAPAAGVVECDRATGELNFSATELASSPNSPVFYQQQRFQPIDEPQAPLGPITNDPILALNPIPPTGSKPRIRIGFREVYLTPLEEPVEPLTSPPSGSVAWSGSTGVLLFNATDLATFTDENVYYDGVILEDGLSLPFLAFGTMGAPGSFVFPHEDYVITFIDGGGTRRAFRTVLKKYELPALDRLDEDVLDDAGSIPLNEIQIAADTGLVRLSSAAVTKYGAATALTVVDPDLSILHDGVSHGWSMRFFPTPVNPEREDSEPKDITVRTSLSEQVLSESLGFGDRVILSNLPIQGSLAISVHQNSGFFIGDLPSWDTVAPSFTGLVHILDVESRSIRFGERHVLAGLSVLPDRVFTLPNQFLVPGSVELSLNAVPLTPGDDVIFDLIAGQVIFIETFGLTRTTGFRGETDTVDTFRDLTQDFVAAGVVAGDRLIVLSGPASIQGSYEITSVTMTELTVDNVTERATPFTSTGDTGLVYEVHAAPEVLADNTFDPVVTQDPFVEVYRRPVSGPDELLTFGVDYTVAPELNTVVLSSEPLREGEKLRIVFNQANEDGTDTGVQFDEILGIRTSEIIDPYNSASHTFQFNSAGSTVVEERGAVLDVQGRTARPSKYTVNFDTSTVRILDPTRSEFKHPNEQRLEAGPNRLTYYVEEAAGGEVAFQVLNGPIYSPPYLVPDSATEIVVTGDQTSTLVVGRIVRVGRELAEIALTLHNIAADETTVTFTGQLKAAQRNPDVWVSRFTPSFVSLGASYIDAPVGSLIVRIVGDVTALLAAGTVLRFGVQVHIVSESTFNGTHTEVRLRTKARETLKFVTHPVSYSTRPVFEIDQQTFTTSLSPLLNPAQPRLIALFVRRPPLPGVELVRDVDYTVAGGTVTLNAGLQSGEVLDFEYTGLEPQSGTMDATYTRYIAPNDDNGLLRQRLVADMVLKTPDSWLCRVEPVAQFVAETLGDLEERAASLMPSSGPVLTAVGPLANWEQGRRSLIYGRGKLVDEDFVARRMILYTDTLIRALEGFLRWLIGLVPGNVFVDDPVTPTVRIDGPFRFFIQEDDRTLDGWVNPYDPFDASTYDEPGDTARLNDIDDIVKVDPVPHNYSGSGILTATSVGTFKSAWERHSFSRFDPQERVALTRTFDGGSLYGDPLAIIAPPDERSEARLLTHRSSTLLGMNPIPARYLFDYNLTLDDQLQEAPLFQTRSVLFQVVDPEPVVGTDEVLVDLRALGDVDTPLGWEMTPPGFRPNLSIFELVFHCDVFRRGVAGAVYTDVTVTFVAATGTYVRVTTGVVLDLEIGDAFYISLTGTPPTSYPDGLSYKLDRSTHRLLNNASAGAGPPIPPSDGGSPLEVDGLVRITKVGGAPHRIPALFGLPYNDSWDQVPPLLSPLPLSESQSLADELVAIEALRDDTTRGFSGTGGSVPTVDLFVGGGFVESDGEDFTDAPAVEALDMVRITDDPSTPANEGHYLARSAPAPTSFFVHAFKWAETAPVTYSVVIKRGTCDTLPVSIPPNQLEDLSASFLVLLAGVPFPNPAFKIFVTGETGPHPGGAFEILSVVDGTHLELDAPVLGVVGAAYQIDYTALGVIGSPPPAFPPVLNTMNAIDPFPPDLSGVVPTGDPMVVTGSARNSGTYYPHAHSVGPPTQRLLVTPFDTHAATDLTWYVKRGRAVHSGTLTGGIRTSTTFEDLAESITGDLTGTSFAVTSGPLLVTQVGDIASFTVGGERAIITDITAGPTLTLSFTTAPPVDSPPSYGVRVLRNFELDLVGSTHPTRAKVSIGDVLVVTDPTTEDFGRYIISGIAQEFLTVTHESDLVTTGFFSTTNLGLDFRIDDCRRDELNQVDSHSGQWGLALSRVEDAYTDTAAIPEIGYSLLNHLDNADAFIGALLDLTTPLVEDTAATLTDATTVTGSVDFTVAGVVEGDILFAAPLDPSDINHGFYVVASVSGMTVTINSVEGPDFYVSHVVTEKRPSFSSTPVSPTTVRFFTRPSLVSAFALLMVLQEKVQGAEMLVQLAEAADLATHQPFVEIFDGDVSNARIAARIGPDLVTQYATTLTDRLERVRDASSDVLYEDLYRVLFTVDRFYEQRYGWIALRIDRVTGTLPRVRRFDETAEQREEELLAALLMSEGGG